MNRIATEKENNGKGMTANPLLSTLFANSNSSSKSSLLPMKSPFPLMPTTTAISTESIPETLKEVTASEENTAMGTVLGSPSSSSSPSPLASPLRTKRRAAASPRAHGIKSPQQKKGVMVGSIAAMGRALNAKAELSVKAERDALAKRVADLERTVSSLSDDKARLETTVQEKERELEERGERLRELIEENAHMQDVISEKQADLSEVLLRRESLQSHMKQTTDSKRSLEKSLKRMKKEFFFSTVIAIKLSYSNTGTHCNLNAHDLWEAAQRDQIPFSHFPSWIAEYVSSELLKSRR